MLLYVDCDCRCTFTSVTALNLIYHDCLALDPTVGTIDRMELQRGFEMMGLQMERAQVVKIMADYQEDDDKDTLSKEEFTRAIKKWSRTILKHQSTNYGQVMANAHSTMNLQMSKQTVIPIDDEEDNKRQKGGASSKTPLKGKDSRRSYQAVADQDEEDLEVEYLAENGLDD